VAETGGVGEEPFVLALRARCAGLAGDAGRAEADLARARGLFTAAGAPARAAALAMNSS